MNWRCTHGGVPHGVRTTYRCRSVIILSRQSKHSLGSVGRSSRWLELGFADHWTWLDHKRQKRDDVTGSPLLGFC
jgi:hypothetical protein